MIFLKGIDEYMLPCINKKIFGIDCLGCGMQRATVLFFRGEFAAAFHMYPALYTLLLLLGFVIFNSFVKFKFDNYIKISLIALNIIIIIVSYFFKMSHYM